MRSKLLGIGLALALVASMPLASGVQLPDDLPVVSVMATGTDVAPMAPAIVTAFTAPLCDVATMTPSASVSALPELRARSRNGVFRTYMSPKLNSARAPIVAEVGGWPSSTG